MVFPVNDKTKIISGMFPLLTIEGKEVKFETRHST